MKKNSSLLRNGELGILDFLIFDFLVCVKSVCVSVWEKGKREAFKRGKKNTRFPFDFIWVG